VIERVRRRRVETSNTLKLTYLDFLELAPPFINLKKSINVHQWFFTFLNELHIKTTNFPISFNKTKTKQNKRVKTIQQSLKEKTFIFISIFYFSSFQTNFFLLNRKEKDKKKKNK